MKRTKSSTKTKDDKFTKNKTPKNITLDNGVEMRSYINNPPMDIINQLSVRRSDDAEYGPVDLFNILDDTKKYYINFNYDDESIDVVQTSKNFKLDIPEDYMSENVCKS